MSNSTTRPFLAKDATVALKGILALMVLVSHIHGKIDLFDTSILGTLFSAFGYLGVSAFFFLSGFGIYEQFKSKPEYVSIFPKRRILPFYCLCITCIFIYLLRDLIVYRSVDLKLFLLSFAIGNTIVDNGWYLQVQLLLYIIFFVIFWLVKRWKIATVAFATLAYCVICVFAGLSSTWYEAVFCFTLGMVVSYYKPQIELFLTKKLRSIIVLLACVAVFVVALFLGNKRTILPNEIRIVVKILSSLLFVPCVAISVSLVNINNVATRFLGKISLEIYVMQGIALKFFYDTLEIENDWLYILAVVVTTLLISLVTYPLFNVVNSIGKKRERRKNEH